MTELPIAEFLRERLKEYDSTFEVRKGTAFDNMVFKPLQFIMQPFRDETTDLFIGQSLRRILQLPDPNAFDEEQVNDIVENLFVYRNEGSVASGVARVYYSYPVAREWAATGFTVIGQNGKNYTNPAPFIITASQMRSQTENGVYYLDIPVASTELGDENNLDEDGLTTVLADPFVISVTNKAPIKDGRNRESNVEYINRAKRSISVRDLVTGKGFSATLLENFPASITEIQAIGMGDVEMMRDIVSNCHIGGKHDGYIKTFSVTTKSKDFIGNLIDTTRAAWTTTQISLYLTTWAYLGETSIDRTKAAPVVSQVKPSISASFTGTADLSTTVNLAGKEYIKLTIDDGSTKTIRVAGASSTQTKRTEIIQNINNAVGVDVAFAYSTFIKIVSPTSGLNSRIVIEEPGGSYGNALLPVFGISDPSVIVLGDGPIIFQEDLHYEVNDVGGDIRRVIPSGFLVAQDPLSTGLIEGALLPTDIVTADNLISPALFALVEANDILTIVSGTYAGDYRILSKIDDLNIQIDATFSEDLDITDNYYIKRTGIKNGELLYIEYYYNPLSIDICKYVKLDEYGINRGIRPGRENYTITDLPFLKINSIEVIDPVSGSPTGEVLEGEGGYGMGGYGEGSYGVGSSAQYRLVVNEPTSRFSLFEDSYIVFDSTYQGYSFRIHYDCTPELESVHDFCRSDSERVLDGDILIKHFIPAYVDASIEYLPDTTDSTIPDSTTLTSLVKDFINSRPAGTDLDASDIVQFILKQVDPYSRYTGKVKPFTMTATIHNTDGTTTMLESSSILSIPVEDPFPKYTEAPLSPKIAHWMAGNIVMTRL